MSSQAISQKVGAVDCRFNVGRVMVHENDTKTEKWARGGADDLLSHVVDFLPNNQHVDIFLLMTGCLCPKHSMCLSVCLVCADHTVMSSFSPWHLG